MRSPGGIRHEKNIDKQRARESTTSHTQDETDHDDDASVGNLSIADQARRSWMAKDAQIQRSNRSLMAEQHQHQPPRTTQSPGRFRNKNLMPSLGSSRWGNSASSVANNLKAPMSWHGGKGKLSPSRLSTNLAPANPLTPPFSKHKSGASTNFGSPKMPTKSSSSKTNSAGGKDDSKSVKSFIRGSKIYKIQAPFNAIKSFVPMVSSDSSVKSSTSKASRWSTNTHDTKGTAGLSVEPLPDRWASKKRAEKEPALAVPVEEDEEDEAEDYEEDYEDEVIDLNDNNQADEGEPSEDFDKEFEKPVHFGKGPVREFVVDRVPRKKWTSRNVEDSPIWPPIIKVRGYEACRGGNVSAISIGSGFTDDDYLTDDFSSDEEDSFIDKARALPPAQRTSYRIRYDGPTNLNLDAYKADNRFASTVELVQPEGAPNLPARNMDSTPGMPPRRHSEHSHGDGNSGTEYSEELAESKEFAEPSMRSRPDVWITALSGEQEEDVIWNVRRVWDLEQEDEGEKEVSVHSQQLFSKLRTLVGAADDESVGGDRSQAGTVTSQKSDVKPRIPSRSWQIQKVVEAKGKLEGLEPSKQLDDKEVENDIQAMNSDAVVWLRENIKAQEELVRKITKRRIEKKEKAAKGIVEAQVEDTEEAAPPLTKEEQDKWFADDEESETMDGSMQFGEQDAPPPSNPQRHMSDSADTMISVQESIISNKREEKSKEAVIVEENMEKVDTALKESMHSTIENGIPVTSTAKVEKASEAASVNSLDSLQSSIQSMGGSRAAAPAADKEREKEKVPTPPLERTVTRPPPPPPAAHVTPPQKRRSLSPKSPKTPKTAKSPGRKGGKKKSKSSSKSPRTPGRKSLDEAPRTPRRNNSDELDATEATPKTAKRERRKGKKKKTSKKKKENKSSAAEFSQTSSSESEVEARPSSEKISKGDKRSVSPRRRVTALDAKKLSMAAMVVGSDSDSDGSSDSNTDAATKNLMKKHQASSGAATPWWKKQQQQQASKKGSRPSLGRKAQSDRYLGKK
ncbi:MAG: hypothetical protein SGBAC_006144 [Bacillariaceae sp.]